MTQPMYHSLAARAIQAADNQAAKEKIAISEAKDILAQTTAKKIEDVLGITINDETRQRSVRGEITLDLFRFNQLNDKLFAEACCPVCGGSYLSYEINNLADLGMAMIGEFGAEAANALALDAEQAYLEVSYNGSN